MDARVAARGTFSRWALRLALAYALLIQGFAAPLSSTLHALALQGFSDAGVMCLPSRQDAPQRDPAAHDGLCCLLGCTSSQPVAAGPAPVAMAVPERRSVALRLDVNESQEPPSAKRRGCEARGPPGIA